MNAPLESPHTPDTPDADPGARRGDDAPVIAIEGLSKVYGAGKDAFEALKPIDLAIRKGEIFALLGPNGAGKTTLISIVCGLVRPTAGRVLADGFDVVRQFRDARERIGLVPQELTTDAFETVWDTTCFSRGLFGKPADPAHIEKVLRSLTLWEKKNARIMTLSGGMKRRLMIAKALAHEPTILFLDEPTAGVDVELRREMWDLVGGLRSMGVTIILTTHYIEEAEEMADRVGVINKGEIVLVEETKELMRKLGRKRLTLQLQVPLDRVPDALADYDLKLGTDSSELIYDYDTRAERTGIARLLSELHDAGIRVKDLQTEQSSLEEIFVSLVREERTHERAREARDSAKPQE